MYIQQKYNYIRIQANEWKKEGNWKYFDAILTNRVGSIKKFNYSYFL